MECPVWCQHYRVLHDHVRRRAALRAENDFDRRIDGAERFALRVPRVDGRRETARAVRGSGAGRYRTRFRLGRRLRRNGRRRRVADVDQSNRGTVVAGRAETDSERLEPRRGRGTAFRRRRVAVAIRAADSPLSENRRIEEKRPNDVRFSGRKRSVAVSDWDGVVFYF